MARAFSHADMRKACNTFANWNQNNPAKPQSQLLEAPPSQDLQTIALNFLELQQAREDADYNLSRILIRPGSLDKIQIARDTVDTIRAMGSKNWERRVFLLSLAFVGRWNRQ